MELISVTQRTEEIYSIVFTKGIFFKKTYTEDIHHGLFDWHILRNGNRIEYHLGKSLDSITMVIKIGETYTINNA